MSASLSSRIESIDLANVLLLSLGVRAVELDKAIMFCVDKEHIMLSSETKLLLVHDFKLELYINSIFLTFNR